MLRLSKRVWVAVGVAAAVGLAGWWRRAAEPVGPARQAAGLQHPGPADSAQPPLVPAAPFASQVVQQVPLSGQAEAGLRARLLAWVSSGSPQDAMAAAELLRTCRMTAALEAWTSLARAGDLSAYTTQRLASGEMRLDTVRACGDLQPQDQQQRLPLLQKAAAAGVRNAALFLVDEGPFGDPTSWATRPTDPLVLAWRLETMRLLDLAAQQGDTGALLSLFDQHLTGVGIVVTPDPQAALVYRTALDLVYEQSKGRVLPDKHSAINALQARLTKSEFDEAVARGQAMATQIFEIQRR
jgi:TPR repeat protein